MWSNKVIYFRLETTTQQSIDLDILVSYFVRSAKRRISGSPFESFSRLFFFFFFTDGQKKNATGSAFEMRLPFKNKAQAKRKRKKWLHPKGWPPCKIESGKERKKEKGPRGQKLSILPEREREEKKHIYACSVCLNVLLSFSAGLGLGALWNTATPAAKHLHESNFGDSNVWRTC